MGIALPYRSPIPAFRNTTLGDCPNLYLFAAPPQASTAITEHYRTVSAFRVVQFLPYS